MSTISDKTNARLTLNDKRKRALIIEENQFIVSQSSKWLSRIIGYQDFPFKHMDRSKSIRRKCEQTFEAFLTLKIFPGLYRFINREFHKTPQNKFSSMQDPKRHLFHTFRKYNK